MFVGVFARDGVGEKALRFESINEVIVSDAGPEGESPIARMAACSVPCRPACAEVSGAFCLSCPRLVNFVPRGSDMAIRCLWTDEDPVDALMTPEPALVSVSHDTDVREAARVVRKRGVGHLLVVDAGLLVGVVSYEDLLRHVERDDPVSECIRSCPWVVEGSANLARAASLMARRNVNCLPVIGPDKRVRGVVTRGDLRRVGIIIE